MSNKEYAKNNMIPIEIDDDNALVETVKKDAEKAKERKEEKFDKTSIMQSIREFDQPNCWIKKENMTNDALVTWDKLRKEPLVNFRYPINFGEKRGLIQTATLNGLKFILKSDYPVKVPQTIYEIFQGKLDAEHGAGDYLDLDKQSDEYREKLTR